MNARRKAKKLKKELEILKGNIKKPMVVERVYSKVHTISSCFSISGYKANRSTLIGGEILSTSTELVDLHAKHILTSMLLGTENKDTIASLISVDKEFDPYTGIYIYKGSLKILEQEE